MNLADCCSELTSLSLDRCGMKIKNKTEKQLIEFIPSMSVSNVVSLGARVSVIQG